MSLRVLLRNYLYIHNVYKLSDPILKSNVCLSVLNINNYSTFNINKPFENTENTSAPRKKTTPIPKITLILPGDNISVTTLEEAQKISKRRDLKLVKVLDLDTKTERPVYKLMTGAEYLAEDLKKRADRKTQKNESYIKGEKLLTLSSRISDHDLNSRIRNIEKWLTKSYEVRVVINGEADNMTNAEAIYEKLEKSLNTKGRFLQKRQKGSDIRFQILPPKREKNENTL